MQGCHAIYAMQLTGKRCHLNVTIGCTGQQNMYQAMTLQQLGLIHFCNSVPCRDWLNTPIAVQSFRPNRSFADPCALCALVKPAAKHGDFNMQYMSYMCWIAKLSIGLRNKIAATIYRIGPIKHSVDNATVVYASSWCQVGQNTVAITTVSSPFVSQ